VTAIVISYRREDSQATTGRIFDRLEGHYGQGHVFMDIDNIPYGIDFRDHLQEMLDRCDILLVVVGPRWFGRNEDGQPRLLEEEDWVRIEVATALQKKIPVIPLLVEGARMPKRAELPEDLHGFAFRQAAVLDVGVDFRVHMERLTKSMDRILTNRKLPVSQAVHEDVIPVEKRQSFISPADLPRPSSDPQSPPMEAASVQLDLSRLAEEQPSPNEEIPTVEPPRRLDSTALTRVSSAFASGRDGEKANEPFFSAPLLMLLAGASFFAVVLFLAYRTSVIHG
jgi:hypothetical protein